MNAITHTGASFGLTPQSLEEAMKFAGVLAESSIIPKDFQGKVGNILVAIQWGMELGLAPMQAMQSIAVINGRPSLWGDAVIALVRGSPLCEYIREEDDGNTAVCRVKRRGDDQEHVRTFSMEDAHKAGLIGKQGPWAQYPKRMRQMRARAFALRDLFPDVLRGMAVAEELEDISAERDITPRPGPVAATQQALPLYEQQRFEQNLPKWRELIESGKRSADDVIATVASKAALTKEQITAIRGEEQESQA